MKKEAMFYSTLDNERVRCELCPHRCVIAPGKRGLCKVRENDHGRLYTLIYGSVSSVAVDPIEKKPLFHFYPGSEVLSLGTAGCNFRCAHCQNATISQAGPEDVSLEEMPPEKAVRLARRYRCDGIAWTYNEPTIWYEHAYDGAQEAKRAGLYTVWVTNGYIMEEPFRRIAPYLDAMNVDVKASDEGFYREVCGAQLEPVRHTCSLARRLGIHLEITYLIIPGHNDSDEALSNHCDWLVSALGEEVPCHFSRFYPCYKMLDVPSTPLSTLLRAREIAKEKGIKYVYLGNVAHGRYENTYCPQCGELLIERSGFYVFCDKVKDGRCPQCGANIPVIPTHARPSRVMMR